MHGNCTGSARLLQEREKAADAFREALSLLHIKVATASYEEFLQIQRTAHERNEKAEQATLALDAHIRQHGC